jgi:Flp pilus assembly pilin Flp
MRWPAARLDFAPRLDVAPRSATPRLDAAPLRAGLDAVLIRLDPRGVIAGQGIVEYGLILSLSALLAIVLLVFFGATVSAALQVVGDAIDAAT